MPLVVRLRSLLRNLFLSRHVEADLDQEVHSHLEMLTEENIRAGMSPKDAQRAARIELGGIDQVKEQVREERLGNWLHSVMSDCRFGVRQLRKSPGFTSVAILTLALGIGANTAIFTLLDQALFRTLSVKEPNRLVLLRYSGKDTGSSYTRTDNALYFSYPMYRDLRDHNSVFSGLIATAWTQVGVQWHNEPDLADAELVSGNYFDVLGIQPALGRLFVPTDDLVQEASPVVVLNFDYWQRRFASDRRVVDQSILINGHPFTVIGVARAGFHSVVAGDAPGIFVPMMMKPQVTPGWNDLDVRRSNWLNIIGRLKPGLTLEHAQAGLAPLWHSIRESELSELGYSSQSFRDAFLTNSHLFLVDGSRGLPVHGAIPTTLLVVMGMSGLTILMACTNVGTLLLVRAAARTREISVRVALGATRNRVAQQLLSEGLLLGLAGGLIGLFLAPQISALLIHAIWVETPGALAFSSHPDLRVLLFNFSLAVLVSVLFSLAPVVQFWRPDLTPAFKQQSTGVAGGPLRLRRLLVVAQISLSLLLLVGAGLLVRTLHNLRAVPVGFSTDHLIAFSVDPRLTGYESSYTEELYRQMLDKLQSIPGVRSAAATNDPELSNNNTSRNITVAGYRPTESEDMNVEWSKITPGYFATLKMPLRAGRDLAEQDRRSAQKVAVVNESFARHYFGEPQKAIGQYFGGAADNVKVDIQIVGVVGDVKHTNVRDPVDCTVYLPVLQEEPEGGRSFGMAFYVRTWQTPESAESSIRQAIHMLDSKLVLNDFRTMQEQIDEVLSGERVVAFLASSFGLLCALMAAIGIYGVLAYTTVQRTREFGIRLALGATHGAVVRIVLAEVVWLAGIGIVAGLPVSLLFAYVVRSLLYGVSKSDPLTLCIAVVSIILVALAAAALPSRRATKVDPIIALRYE